MDGSAYIEIKLKGQILTTVLLFVQRVEANLERRSQNQRLFHRQCVGIWITLS